MASDLRVQADLIVAISDLKLVRGIRNAVRVNLLKQGGREGLLGNIENPKPAPSLANFGEQRHGAISPAAHAGQPRVEHHRAIESPARCHGYVVPHATHPIARLPDLTPTDVTLPTSDAERASGLPSRHPSPLAPPWALPLPAVRPAVTRIKWRVQAADLRTKGSLLDRFL